LNEKTPASCRNYSAKRLTEKNHQNKDIEKSKNSFHIFQIIKKENYLHTLAALLGFSHS